MDFMPVQTNPIDVVSVVVVVCVLTEAINHEAPTEELPLREGKSNFHKIMPDSVQGCVACQKYPRISNESSGKKDKIGIP